MDLDQDLLFYSDVDENTTQWLDSLQKMWEHWKKSDCVSSMLTKYFEAAENPYLSTLRILVNMSDFKHIKITSSLTYTAAEEFSKWISGKKQFYASFLVPDMKLAAFRLVSKQKNMHLVKMMCTIYEFTVHKKLFLPFIEAMIYDGKYKEAVQYATLLELQSYFTEPETLLLPLVLQNKTTMLDEFLENCPEAQKALVSYLDNLLSPGRSVQEIVQSYIGLKNLSDIKLTMQTKSVTKLIGRLIKTYNLPLDMCPNLVQRQSKGALYYLLNKRYEDGTFNKESWREMVENAVDDDPKIQIELITMLASRNDPSESLYFANLFRIPRQKWPWNVVCYEDQLNDFEGHASISGEDDWDLICGMSEDYHTLALPMDCVKLVDDAKSFEKFVNKDLKGVRIVGIDAEWKPRFALQKATIALMQIATVKNVYILDVTTIGGKYSELWIKLGANLFGNKNILKLGFGSSQDTKIIHDSLPALGKVKAYGPGHIDMHLLWRVLSNNHKFRFPFEGDPDSRKGGLSKLVELCLGRKLNKSNQCSNWEQRPLRKSQIAYAALDAYCLIEVFDVLSIQCEKLNIPFEEICAEIEYMPYKFRTTTKKPSANAQYKPECKTAVLTDVGGCKQKKVLQPANAQRQQEKSATKNHSVKHKNIEKTGQKHVHKESLPSASTQHQSEKSEVKNNSGKHKNVGKNGQKHTDKESLQPINTQHQPGKSAVNNSTDKHKNVVNIEQEHNYKDSLQLASGQNQAKKSTPKNNTDKHKNVVKIGQEHNYKDSLQPTSGQNQPKKSTAKNNTDKHKNAEESGEEPNRRNVTKHEKIQENDMDSVWFESTVNDSWLPNCARTVPPKSIPAHTWRVVCDSMLGCLSNKLRTFGCDCIHIEYDQGGYMSAMLASRENRILLTRNTEYQRFLQFLPPGSCYRVINEESKDQLREVLTYFNVIVTRNDIFSRCLNCNSDEFANVPKSLMHTLLASYVKVNKLTNLTSRHEYECLSNPLMRAFHIDEHNKISNQEHNFNKAAKSHKVKIPERTWRLSNNSLNVHTCTTKYNVQIQIGNVPIKTLENIELFYVCERCGKVFWDSGTYLERLLNGALKDLIVQ